MPSYRSSQNLVLSLSVSAPTSSLLFCSCAGGGSSQTLSTLYPSWFFCLLHLTLGGYLTYFCLGIYLCLSCSLLWPSAQSHTIYVTQYKDAGNQGIASYTPGSINRVSPWRSGATGGSSLLASYLTCLKDKKNFERGVNE